MVASPDLQHLLRVLKERDVSLAQDDVAWAFGNTTRHEIEPWIQEHLSPASLLTKEELIFYEKQAQYAAKDPNATSSGRPLSDNDFEAAIASLEASSAAIAKQCQLMEAQKDALQTFKSRHGSEQGADQARAQRQKQLAREKSQLDFETEELTDVLRSRLRESSKQADAAVSALSGSVEKVFEKDDRLLDGLQKLLPKLADVGASAEVEVEVERLCQALIALTSQVIRSRIDDAYRSAAGPRQSPQNGHDSSSEKQQVSLRAELEELSGEIDSLATMAVDSQYRQPIMRELKNSKTDSESDKARWGDYVLATLQYLTARVEELDDHYHDLHAHYRALRNVTAALDGVVASPTPSKAQPSLRSPATPMARGLKPLRLVQANLSEDPTSQLLRHFDIRTADPNDTSKLATTLERAIHERQDRLGELGGGTERTLSDQLGQTMRKADRDVEDLLGAVYAHSPYGTVRLVDAGIQAALEGLEEKTQDLGQQMRSLDIDGLAKKARVR
ncbi:hypothetical protein LTR36_010019 [Oleoguttula mirabilis]|uniref:HAUS augmin-like complex subunit 3 N-terminal domain-containing protein n=1 Tax=Oleoguttula mirabilis TaxID=1507867 RepID=A0AAV9JRP4_9PEZI|nr:hypothetical protein LTR36_010019 [Oleoguttula mirabilis]